MNPDRWRQVKELFDQVLEITPDGRPSFLDRACSNDTSLRQEVESLLSADGEARSSFFQGHSVSAVTLDIGSKLGPYEIISLIGAGGMGEVYRAHDSQLGRDVAIKVLPAFLSSDKERLRRFEQEARAAAALNHPNILAVFQMGMYDGAPYLVTELLEGETLREQMKRRPLTVRKAVEQGVQIARGLVVAHEKGIVHRDLKPENLFATRDGRIKILDFGLAKLKAAETAVRRTVPKAEDRGTEPGLVMGTVGYMSPEQVRGEPADHRADIFSFGAILYEMLSGRRAFHKPTSAETMSAILNEETPSISGLVSAVLPSLQRVVHRCLEKAPEQRFQSASDLAFALEALSESDRPTTVAIPQPKERWRKKWIAAAGFVAVIATVFVLSWLGWPHSPPQHQPELTERQITTTPPENPVESAAISPDAKFLAYGDQTGLMVRSMVSGEARPVSLPAELATRLLGMRWLPEGGKLLAEKLENPGRSLWVVTVLGEEPPRKLRDHAAEVAISPDGRMMAFASGGRHDNAEIWVSGINGDSPQKLVAEQSGAIASPVWSPDGKWIAYWRGEDVPLGNRQQTSGAIEVRPATGGPAKTVVSQSNLPAPNVLSCSWKCLCWSPDGRLIFSAAQTSESHLSQKKYSLWQVLVDPLKDKISGEPVRISAWTDSRVVDLTITADGRQLAFVKTKFHQDVYVGELEHDVTRLKAQHRLTLDNNNSYPDGWTPDSKAVLFHSDRAGRYQAFKQELARSIPERIVTSSMDVTDPSLSPDGASMLYWETVNAEAGIKSGLMRQPTAGGAPETILEVPDHEKFWFFCPRMPGRPCVLSQQKEKELLFYPLDPLRGQGPQVGKIEVATDSIYYWQVSPDGSQLAVVDRSHKDHIELLRLSDGTWRDFAVEPGWGNFQTIAWAANGKGFFLTSGLPDSYNLLFVTPSGKVHRLLGNARRQWMVQPRASPDGRYLAFQAQTWDNNVWLLEDPHSR
jgi:serine/threonine protein kinase/Tol biopolymer transport system component